MKFNVEIDIDYIEDGGNLNDEIKDQIISTLTRKVDMSFVEDIKKTISTKVSDKIDILITEAFNDFMSKPITKYDAYGDVVEEISSLKEMMKKKLDTFLTQQVDSYGKETKYNGEPRYRKILNDQSKEQIDTFMRDISKIVVEGIKKDIDAEAKTRVTNAILGDYKLKDLVK